MKKLIAVLLCVAMVFAFAACTSKAPEEKNDTSSAAPADSDLAYIKDQGKLVVGITDFEPMDYKEKDSDEWVGFDADMAKSFAKFLGVDVEFVEIEWDNKVFELKDKKIDCVWNGMTLTDEVKAAMDCSEAYMNNAQVVVVAAADADKYQKAEDCKDLAFAVEAGSAGKAMAEENGYNFTEVKDQATALMEVKAGKADAAIIDSLMAAAMVGEGTDYADYTTTVKLNAEEYGVGFRQGSDLVAKFAEWFAAATADGSLKACAEQYKVQGALIAE